MADYPTFRDTEWTLFAEYSALCRKWANRRLLLKEKLAGIALPSTRLVTIDPSVREFLDRTWCLRTAGHCERFHAGFSMERRHYERHLNGPHGRTMACCRSWNYEVPALLRPCRKWPSSQACERPAETEVPLLIALTNLCIPLLVPRRCSFHLRPSSGFRPRFIFG